MYNKYNFDWISSSKSPVSKDRLATSIKTREVTDMIYEVRFSFFFPSFGCRQEQTCGRTEGKHLELHINCGSKLWTGLDQLGKFNNIVIAVMTDCCVALTALPLSLRLFFFIVSLTALALMSNVDGYCRLGLEWIYQLFHCELFLARIYIRHRYI